MKKMKTTLFKVLASAVSVAALCAASGAASAQAIKLWQVTSGFIEADKGFVTSHVGVGTKDKFPVTMHVIQHPRGLIVFDTGVNVAVAEGGCASYWGAGVCGVFNARQSRDEVIDRQLEKLGFKAADVKYVIYSHFHLDHAGNVHMFPKAKHVVQNAELKNAWWPEKFQRGGFVLKDFDKSRDYDFIELAGDFDLFGDGTVTVLDTKGHTQGHQSLMLKLPKTGYVILSGDAIATAELAQGMLPVNPWSLVDTLKSVDRLKQFRDTRNGALWYSHDPAQYEANKGKVFE